jgi:hypothetical protein
MVSLLTSLSLLPDTLENPIIRIYQNLTFLHDPISTTKFVHYHTLPGVTRAS